MSDIAVSEILATADMPALDTEDFDGTVITGAFVVLVRQHPDWECPRPIFASMRGKCFEEQIGLLTSVLDKLRSDNVRSWATD